MSNYYYDMSKKKRVKSPDYKKAPTWTDVLTHATSSGIGSAKRRKKQQDKAIDKATK